MNLLPSSDVRYSTKDVCQSGPSDTVCITGQRKTFYVEYSHQDGKGSSCRYVLLTELNTDHNVQNRVTVRPSKKTSTPGEICEKVSVGLVKNSPLLYQYRIYTHTNTRTHAHTHAHIPTTTRESSSKSAFPSRASKKKCVNFGAT